MLAIPNIVGHLSRKPGNNIKKTQVKINTIIPHLALDFIYVNLPLFKSNSFIICTSFNVTTKILSYIIYYVEYFFINQDIL